MRAILVYPDYGPARKETQIVSSSTIIIHAPFTTVISQPPHENRMCSSQYRQHNFTALSVIACKQPAVWILYARVSFEMTIIRAEWLILRRDRSRAVITQQEHGLFTKDFSAFASAVQSVIECHVGNPAGGFFPPVILRAHTNLEKDRCFHPSHNAQSKMYASRK